MGACGLTVPDIKEVWDADRPADDLSQGAKISGTAQIEFEIKKRIYCELRDAVRYVNGFHLNSGSANKPTKTKKLPLPADWGAQVSISLEVDESSALSPGVAVNQVLPNAIKVFGPQETIATPQSFSLGFGGTVSSTATRIDKFDPYYSVKYLMASDSPSFFCGPGTDPFIKDLKWTPASSSPFILESNLGIKDWLLGAIFVNDNIPSSGAPATIAGQSSGSQGAQGSQGSQKADTVSLEIKFVIVSSGNVTPTWKLVRATANTTTPLFSAGRTRTHDLIITIGPPGQQSANSHLASQIGNAVSNANRAAPATQ